MKQNQLLCQITVFLSHCCDLNWHDEQGMSIQVPVHLWEFHTTIYLHGDNLTNILPLMQHPASLPDAVSNEWGKTDLEPC